MQPKHHPFQAKLACPRSHAADSGQVALRLDKVAANDASPQGWRLVKQRSALLRPAFDQPFKGPIFPVGGLATPSACVVMPKHARDR